MMSYIHFLYNDIQIEYWEKSSQEILCIVSAVSLENVRNASNSGYFKKKLSPEFLLLFNEAEKIRNTILSKIDSRRDMKSIEAKFKKLMKKGDLVKVKKLLRIKEKKNILPFL